MRAVVWLAGCLFLLWAANELHLWRPMRDTMLIVFIWMWIFGGAAWVTSPKSRRHAQFAVTAGEADALQKAAQKAADLQRQDRGEPTP